MSCSSIYYGNHIYNRNDLIKEQLQKIRTLRQEDRNITMLSLQIIYKIHVMEMYSMQKRIQYHNISQ